MALVAAKYQLLCWVRHMCHKQYLTVSVDFHRETMIYKTRANKCRVSLTWPLLGIVSDKTISYIFKPVFDSTIFVVVVVITAKWVQNELFLFLLTSTHHSICFVLFVDWRVEELWGDWKRALAGFLTWGCFPVCWREGLMCTLGAHFMSTSWLCGSKRAACGERKPSSKLKDFQGRKSSERWL